MKHALRFVLCAVALLATILSTQAALQLRISDGTPAGTIIVTDQDPNDFIPEVGVVSYSGTIGTNWIATLSTGTSKPLLGSAATPRVDLQTFNVSSVAGGTLTIELTDTDFTGAGPATIAIGGNSAGLVNWGIFTDNSNAQFGKATSVSAVGPLTGNFAVNNVGLVTATAPFSITFELSIVHAAGGVTGLDAELVVRPPLICPPDVALDCDDSLDPNINLALGKPIVFVQPDCNPVVSNYVDLIVGNVVTRTWTIADACFNTNFCVQTILIATNCNPPQTNCVQRAVGGGPCSDSESNHALWLPGIATDFYFAPSPGTFVENPDGTAQISGRVVSASNPGKCFDVDVQLSGRTSTAPPGSPKKDLKDCAYSEDGGPVNTDNWYYYTNFTGVLTGCGDYAGASLTLVPTGPAFQVGLGASGKNLHYGASAWFVWTVTAQPDSGPALPVTGQGDFNLDIVDCIDRPVTNCVQKADGGGKCSDATTHHAVWMPGIGTDFVFYPNAGSIVENLDGTAQITGTIAKTSNLNQGFDVVVNLTGRTSVPPPGSPKKDLKDCAYEEDGGPVDTDDWYYYTSFTGTFTGIGEYAGAVITIVPTGPAFQIGLGASGKNLKFGASAWFIWTVETQPQGAPLQVTGQGDFNLDIGDCPEPTQPGTGSICGKVKRDCDANGSVSGEAGLEGWTVTLKSGASIIDTDVTDALGDYCFSNLPEGTYQLVVTPLAGWKQTYDPDGNKDNKHTVHLDSGENKTGKYFGYTGVNADVLLIVSGPPTANCGDTITYTFAVTNTGNTCLYGGIKVKSPLLGGQIFHQTPVAPGEGFAFTRTYVIKASDDTPLVNNVTAIGDPPGSLANVVRDVSVTTLIVGHCPPAAPTGLTDKAGNGQVKLCWNAVSGASSYKVKRSTTKGGPYVQIASGITSTCFTDTNVVNGVVYYYVVVSSRYAVPSANSAEVSSIPTAGLPSPWKTKDIGPVADAGGASEAGGTFTVIGSGKYIWGTSDEFRYVYQQANGNCEIIARVVSLDDTHGWAKAGVMIRSSLSANAKHASAFITLTNGLEFQARASTGSSSLNTFLPGITPPHWLKVTRTGNTFRGYQSTDGVTWTEFGSQTVSMGSSVYIGLAVTSHDDGVLNTAIFDNVSATP